MSATSTSIVRPTLSLTGVLLTSSSWESSVQLLMFAAAQRVKILPEALLAAHRVIHPAGNPRLVAALLSHLQRAGAMPYKLPRSTWESGLPRPDRLFFHHVNTQCAQGHWMESIRLLQRTSARPGLRPLLLGSGQHCSDAAGGGERVGGLATPFFYGSNMITERLLYLWGIDESCASQRTADYGALAEASREALWLIASCAPASGVCGVSYFRLMCELLAHHTNKYEHCCDYVRQALLLHRRHISSSNMFRCAAQRAAHKAVQCSHTTAEVVDVLQILTSNGVKADEEVVIEALSIHPTMRYDTIAFARPLAVAFMSHEGLAQCVAASHRGIMSATSIDTGVSVVVDQWTFLANLGDHNNEAPSRLYVEDRLRDLLHSKMELATFLVRLFKRHAAGRHRDAAIVCARKYEQTFVDAFRALLSQQSSQCQGGESEETDNLPNVVSDIAALVSILSGSAQRAWVEQVHNILATPHARRMKVWVVQLVATVNVMIGLPAADLLRIIPRALDIVPAASANSNGDGAANSNRQVFRRLLDSCIQRPSAVALLNHDVDDILIPLVLQFFVSQCGFTWIAAIQHVQTVAGTNLGSKYLMMPVASLISQHTTSSWVTALRIVEQSVPSEGQKQTVLFPHPEAVAVATAALQFWSLQVLLTVAALPQVSSLTKFGITLRILQSPLCEESVVNEVCRSLASTSFSASELEMAWSSKILGAALYDYPQLGDVLRRTQPSSNEQLQLKAVDSQGNWNLV